MTQIPRIKKVLVGLLYFNKSLPAFERSLARNIDFLGKTELIDTLSLRETHGLAVDMARNVIVDYAVTTGYDAIIWMDTDMIFPDDAMAKLISMSNAGHPIAAGVYRRGIGNRRLLTEIEWMVECELDELQAIKRGGVCHVAMSGGGYSIVRPHVYMAILRHFQGNVPWYNNYDWLTGNKQCGEDRFFMLRAKDVGVTPVVDPDLHAIHWPPGTSPVPVLDNDPMLDMVRDYL